MNALPRRTAVRVLELIVEGNSIRSTERITGVHRDTITNLLVSAGRSAQALLCAWMRDLEDNPWQIDEVWTFCRKKQRRLTTEEHAKGIWGDQYIYLALGEETKVVPTFHVGKRDEANARKFISDFASRLRTGREPTICTDAFLPYPSAIRAAFGDRVNYGQIIKNYAKKKDRTSTEPFTSRMVISGYMDESDICTSHVERCNLTIRTFMRRMMRRTLGFSKKLENLKAAVALCLACYNFCNVHRTLKMTPAMAAGLVDEPLSLEQMLDYGSDWV